MHRCHPFGAPRHSQVRFLVSLLIVGFLTACGGGGSYVTYKSNNSTLTINGVTWVNTHLSTFKNDPSVVGYYYPPGQWLSTVSVMKIIGLAGYNSRTDDYYSVFGLQLYGGSSDPPPVTYTISATDIRNGLASLLWSIGTALCSGQSGTVVLDQFVPVDSYITGTFDIALSGAGCPASAVGSYSVLRAS